MQRGLLLGALLVTLSQARAVERTLRIEAPAMVAAGQPLSIVISASTDAGKGEQVGFLHVEVSMDEGKTWTAICYLQKSGPRVVQRTSLTAGPAGATVMLRARAAFRDGVAGDVDYSGAPIRWEGSWTEWMAPPAKRARIVVKAP
jgi:hypothetical protein